MDTKLFFDVTGSTPQHDTNTIRMTDTNGNTTSLTIAGSIYSLHGTTPKLTGLSLSCANGAYARVDQATIEARSSPDNPLEHFPTSPAMIARLNPPSTPAQSASSSALAAAIANQIGPLKAFTFGPELLLRGSVTLPLGDMESPLTAVCDGLKVALKTEMPGR